MSISLVKGQKIDLTKTHANLTSVTVGLGWDPIKKKGVLGLAGSNVDCDASVFMLGEDGKLNPSGSIVYYGKKTSPCGSVKHSGDNLTGDGDGDDEQIKINFNAIPSEIHKLVFVVNIYSCISRKQHFGMIKNAFIRVIDNSGKELIRYNLSEDYCDKTALVVGELYRNGNEWKFSATGEGTTDPDIKTLSKRY